MKLTKSLSLFLSAIYEKFVHFTHPERQAKKQGGRGDRTRTKMWNGAAQEYFTKRSFESDYFWWSHHLRINSSSNIKLIIETQTTDDTLPANHPPISISFAHTHTQRQAIRRKPTATKAKCRAFFGRAHLPGRFGVVDGVEARYKTQLDGFRMPTGMHNDLKMHNMHIIASFCDA